MFVRHDGCNTIRGKSVLRGICSVLVRLQVIIIQSFIGSYPNTSFVVNVNGTSERIVIGTIGAKSINPVVTRNIVTTQADRTCHEQFFLVRGKANLTNEIIGNTIHLTVAVGSFLHLVGCQGSRLYIISHQSISHRCQPHVAVACRSQSKDADILSQARQLPMPSTRNRVYPTTTFSI